VQDVGTNVDTQITNGGYVVYDPSWSYDGNYIVHLRAAWAGDSVPESIQIRNPSGGLLASWSNFSATGRKNVGSPDWSPDGKHIVVTAYDSYDARELRLITLANSYDFVSPTTTRVLVPTNFAGNSEDPTDGQFSPDGKYVYFHADSDVAAGRLYRVNVASGVIEPIFGDGVPMRRAYSVSISSDGSTLIHNSELYKDNVPHHIDEELLSVGLQTGIITPLTELPGNQYGRFAKNGVGKEILLLSNATATGPYDLFLYENGTMTAPLTTTHKVANGFDWVK
jgi:Tol biopolymer transport system component